ncbi:MAG: hypothetical protein WBM07_10410 [Chitinivibrionales bacterium]
MSKKSKKAKANSLSSPWVSEDGIHMMMPSKDMSKEQIEALTLKYQENIRKSEIWSQIVKQYGKDEAENLLKEFRVEIRE